MEKNEYTQKAQQLLNDNNTYKIEKTNPTDKIQKQNNNLINNWYNKKLIDVNTKNQLSIHNAQPPAFYGLPKIHKPNIPLRPIVSNIQSPTYNTAKFLGNSLSKILGKTDYYIKYSWQFQKFIINQIIPKTHTIISLDIESLYTNTPTDLALEIINTRWNEINPHTPLNKEDYIKGVKMCLDSTYFEFNKQYYSQISGIAMGSPLAAPIANLVMEHIETNIIKNLNFQPIFYKRYVDDIITCIPTNQISNIHNIFNNFHNKLNFTIEKENNKNINFLDINITYNNKGKIFTNWYHKPTASFRYLNYNSNVPMKYKLNIINNLTDRAIKLSHPKFRKNNIQFIKKILKNNSYPQDLINKTIKKRIHAIYNTEAKNKNDIQTNHNYIALPYVKHLSEKINNTLSQYKYKVAHKLNNTTNQYFTKLKPKIEKNKQTHVVYKIQCKDCDSCYIGQTKQYLYKRIQAHKYSKTDKTALMTHKLEHNHQFDYNNTTIIDKENNTKKREIKEMIHIKREPKSINNRNDIKNLSTIYYNLI